MAGQTDGFPNRKGCDSQILLEQGYFSKLHKSFMDSQLSFHKVLKDSQVTFSDSQQLKPHTAGASSVISNWIKTHS